MTEYDKELIEQLNVLGKDIIAIEIDAADRYFELLNIRFPIAGTKINWDGFSSDCKKTAIYSEQTDFSDFIANIQNSCNCWKNDEEDIIYIGDSLTENAYKLFFSDLISFFNLINEIPQHHYFLNENGDWCLCLDTSNYLDFSFAPENKHSYNSL